MRFLAVAFLTACPMLLAQQPRGGNGYGGYVNPSGLSPTAVNPLAPNFNAGPRYNGRAPRNRGAGAFLTAPPPVAHPSHSRTVIVPYPVYYGGYYYGYDTPPAPGYAPGYAGDYGDQNGGNPGYDQGYDQGYNATAPGPSPVVIINQNFRPDTGPSVVHDYSNSQLPDSTLKHYDNSSDSQSQPQAAAAPDDSNQVIFLIAMKDHTIFPAVAYWVEGDTLNYVTTQGVHNKASLDEVDRDFSKQLNDERHVDFALPPSK